MLTPEDLAKVQAYTEQAFRDCQAELVKEIAAFIERWPGLNVSARGKLRKCLARDVLRRFSGACEEGER